MTEPRGEIVCAELAHGFVVDLIDDLESLNGPSREALVQEYSARLTRLILAGYDVIPQHNQPTGADVLDDRRLPGGLIRRTRKRKPGQSRSGR